MTQTRMPVTCAACGHANPDHAKFCLECGAAIARGCTKCSTPLPTGAKFCLECGTPVAGAGATPAPRSYTPKHLTDKILASKSAFEGERKQVTVLFADVRGSTELANRVDPEDLHGILDRFFAILADGVHRFEGTINQYTGDGIMALFGAPIAHEDHAQRACYAALQLRDALRDHARELKRERGLEFAVRIGINSGDVVVGKIGDDLRMDYTAQGQVVNLAARLEQLADPGSVCVGPATTRLVEGYFELADLGEFAVRGFDAKVRVHELRDVGALHTRFDASRARGLTRFVGRGAEMALLDAALAQARAANGQVVALSAGPGTGKSRLCFEFVAQCRAAGLTVIEASAVPHGRQLSLLPMLAVYRAWFGIGERDDARTAREKIAGRLLLLDERLRSLLPTVFEFLGVTESEREAAGGDAGEREAQLIAVLERLVRSAGPSPIVLLLEDLHWLDAATERFLAQWISAVAGAHALLIVNFRPEYTAVWLERGHVQRIALQPLGAEAVDALLGDLLGADPSVAPLVVRVRERAAGNPFFAEELVLSAVDAGQLDGARGRYRFVAPIDALSVPPRVQAVLAARIDRLDEREKQLLQTAAVIGGVVAEPILAAVAGLDRAALDDALATLERREFVHTRALYPERVWAFKHPVTQEVALGSQLKERRRRIHSDVARILEGRITEPWNEQAAVLAHHFDEAGDALAAARWHHRAMQYEMWTDEVSAYRRGHRIRALLGNEPDGDEAARIAFHARLRLLFENVNQRWEEEAAAVAEEGRRLALRLGDPVSRALFEVELLQIRQIRLPLDVGHVHAELERVRALCIATGDPALIEYASIRRSGTHWAWGEYQVVLDIADRVEATMRTSHAGFGSLLRRVGRDFGDPTGQLQGYGAWAALYLGRFDGLRDAIARVRGREVTPFVRLSIELTDIVRQRFLGELRDMSSCVQRVNAVLAESSGQGLPRRYALEALADASAALEQWTDGVDQYASLFNNETLGPAQHVRASAGFALACIETGALDRAVTICETAIELARERTLRGHEIGVQLALARALRQRDGAAACERIEAALERAAALIDITGARVFAPALAEERAGMAELRGDNASAQAQWRAAQALHVELGALAHAERVAKRIEA